MVKSLIEYLESMPDPRVDRTKRYPLIEIIFLVVCATISGCEGWKSIKDFGDAKINWLKKFLPFEQGIPVDDTIARVMRRLDTKAFQKNFILWMRSVCATTEGDVVAIDGKTLRGSHDNKNKVAAIHMVSAWSSENGVVLGQEKTAEKSNEIKAIPELLEVLELKGCIVTIDAMGCQTAIAEKIIKKKADYILALKGNQNGLFTEAKSFFKAMDVDQLKTLPEGYYEEVDAGHGRIEHRECWAVLANKDDFPSANKWKNIKSIIMVKGRRELKNKVTEETRFFISSLEPQAKKSLNAVRKHWGIENSLHWTLDMTFREDESRIRAESSPENLAIIRHMALNVIKSDTTIKASVKRKRMMAALKDDYRETLIRGLI